MAIQVISTVALSIIVLAGSRVQAYMTDEMRKTILDDHNEARRSLPAANMMELKYDSKLEAVARMYVESQGTFSGHNPNAAYDYKLYGGNEEDGVGENWWSDGPNNAIWAWMDCKWPWGDPYGCSEREQWIAKSEGEDRMAARNSTELSWALYYCQGRSDWLHYSQLMWAKTDKMGCWYTKEFGTLCNYSPQGNMYDYYTGKMDKYVIYGESCSQCPDSAPDCIDGLCTNCN